MRRISGLYQSIVVAPLIQNKRNLVEHIAFHYHYFVGLFPLMMHEEIRLQTSRHSTLCMSISHQRKMIALGHITNHHNKGKY